VRIAIVWAVALAAATAAIVPARAAGQAPPTPISGADALPATIPIFPLDDIMVFPNVARPLHIFEPRYRAMIADALKGDRIIGMVQLRPGYEADYEGRPPVFAIGCAGVISEVEELADGRYNLLLTGLVKFRVLGEDQSRLYRLARVEAIPEDPDAKELAALGPLRERLLDLVADKVERPPRSVADEDVINRLSQYLMLAPGQRQQLLEASGPRARANALIAMLSR
jgi:Lon protease-like protein